MNRQLFILCITLCCLPVVLRAQSDSTLAQARLAFEGRWVIEQKYHTNTLVITFEPGKNYVTVKDIGTGEAPPVYLQARITGKLLVIPARLHVNDYCELEIKNKKLLFKTQPTIWEEDGTARKPNRKNLISRTFTKVKLAKK